MKHPMITGLAVLVTSLTVQGADAAGQSPAIRIDEKRLVIEGDIGSFKTSWNSDN
jgi:hypothetical protein